MHHVAFQNWQVPKNDHVNIVMRIYPLVPVRVASVFADKSNKDIVTDFDESEQPLDKQREVGFPGSQSICFIHSKASITQVY